MRILHTSDWHLGRSFHREGMLRYQAAYFDHLLEVVNSEAVDVVAVAGDVYDRALPHVDAVALFDDVIARLAGSRATVVITSGNHDSARRLGFGSRVFDVAGIHVRTDPSRVAEPILRGDRHGEVAFYGLPYLDPITISDAWALPARTHAAALTAAMARVRSDLDARPPTRSVVLAHAFVAGGQPSESERDITVGGVSRVPTSVFEGVDYAALGHLHGPHELTRRIRYSGSPLAYSFSEATHRKGSGLVDLDGAGAVTAEFVPAPVPRRLISLRGTLDELLTDRAHSPHVDAWIQATITDPLRPHAPMDRLRRRFPHLLLLHFEPPGGVVEAVPSPAPERRTGHEIALDFVDAVRGVPADPAESGLLRRALEACCHDAEADGSVIAEVAR